MDAVTPRPEAYEFEDLTHLFSPRSIAVVGASDRPHSIGNLALMNVVEHSAFKGKVYPINPKRETIAGYTCYPSVAALPEPADVMIVVVPAEGVMKAIEEGAAKGCKFAVILTSGFAEADAAGAAAEARLVEIARASGLRVYGPNCPGLVNINEKLGMSFSPAFKNDLQAGPIGLATQGGGLGRNILQNMERGAGFALWASAGNESDLQVADFIHHMAGAPDVKVIACLMEGIKDGARFARACLHAAEMGVPVVALKVGRSAYGAKAAASHTASITGSAEVNSTVFAQLGVIEVDDLDEIADIADLLAETLPTGEEKVAVFASSGGAASLCADAVGAAGLTLATFTEATLRSLSEALPDYAAINNPIDTTSISISHPQAYADALRATTMDPNVSLVLCPLPMDYGDYTGRNAGLNNEIAKDSPIPVRCVWMSERQGSGYRALAEARRMPFRSLRNMAKAVRRFVDHGRWRTAHDPAWRPLLLTAGAGAPSGPTRTLTEREGKAELRAAGITAPAPEVAATAEEAAAIAARMGGSLAMKIASPDITHKSDLGGVRLAVAPADAAAAFGAIREAVAAAAPAARIEGVLIEPMAPTGGLEVFVGVSRDPVFGHVMTVGLGGIYVEVFKDVARRMLPVTPAMARAMFAELTSAPLLTGARGAAPRDVEALAALVAAVSDYVAANADRVEELDINPVWLGAEGEGAMALDAVVVVRA